MTRVPNTANWIVFASLRIFMLATVAAADSAGTVGKKYRFLYIAKRNHTLSTLYIKRRVYCVFYSISGKINQCQSISKRIKSCMHSPPLIFTPTPAFAVFLISIPFPLAHALFVFVITSASFDDEP